MHPVFVRTGITAAAAVAALAAPVLPAHAAPTSALIFVSPSGTASGSDADCTEASHSTIQTALDDIAAGGTVVVCAGTYTGFATISKPYVTLRGESGADVDATGQPYGIGIAADHVTVNGLAVHGAVADEASQSPGAGIITAGLVGGQPTPGAFATITGNNVSENAAGIDVLTSGNVVSDNVAGRNEVGINVVSDLGMPVTGNTISNNVANHNGGGCGIVIADHSAAGVFGNTVSGNTANGNGLETEAGSNSSGSGIIIATPSPDGNVSGNVVRNNEFRGNGHGGISMHIHAPGADFSGIRLIGNVIGKNNLREDYKDPDTTGIYLGTVQPLTIKVARNLIHNDVVGVFTAGDVTVKGKRSNAFTHVKRPFDGVKKYAG